MRGSLFNKIKRVEKIASVSKLRRMLMQPNKYLFAIIFREFFYKKNKREKEVLCTTFFDSPMNILLPSSTDIYLTGGKSHVSELNLAKFIMNNLDKGDMFLDIGAHYGYFSLLASKLVGKDGKVVAFEASPTTYKILNKNKARNSNMSVYNNVISDLDEAINFYEFPNLYSEYNTIEITQFEEEDWFKDYKPQKVIVKSEILDQFLELENLSPRIIKIDVEGAEYKVIKGGLNFLKNSSTFVVMEYLSDNRGNDEHIKAEQLLLNMGYTTHIINEKGLLESVENISNYLQDNNLESDNIVFTKSQ